MRSRTERISTKTAALLYRVSDGYVRQNDCQLGVAFDGDADRCLAVDENGNLVDGDQIIAICANHMKQHGTLAKDAAGRDRDVQSGLF